MVKYPASKTRRLKSASRTCKKRALAPEFLSLIALTSSLKEPQSPMAHRHIKSQNRSLKPLLLMPTTELCPHTKQCKFSIFFRYNVSAWFEILTFYQA